MKLLFLMTLLPIHFFCQKKDTIDNNQLSLYYNSHNKLYRVVNTQTGKDFEGWGKFESYDGSEYRYYKNNKLIYTDLRDFKNRIIKREIICAQDNKCLEVYEYYDNNIKTPKRKYFLCFYENSNEESEEKKCKEYYEYYRNGQIKIKGQYQGDKEVGIWIYFDDKGKINEKIIKTK
ncbi:antitoxin component YwqK of YwqJK toxin-antitoxin module [Chryseobacterium sp. SORGH_AS 447]|uniref:hypothetical protein n=1 Tax=Chryseobacterium sp. SORGH_AS_0447 TaxID=3041769 RepID=UPI00277F56BC|nr:hypothetical protein [Chryseobacterium sp. SORGH_AS_0447]MDQ1161622.1 antitoxin component YwqK of YwqJK toxin-antitoxin module [Chryseobacterium sp. SORGH_AS_0447]